MRARTSKAKQAEQRGEPAASVEAIAIRAYEIHLSGQGGDDLANWLEAERQLLEAPAVEVAA